MSYCLPNADASACARCGWCKPARIKGWPRRDCPEPSGPEEIALRKAICWECSDWGATGCLLIPEFEREHLTAYKWHHGHCARGCHDGKRKW